MRKLNMAGGEPFLHAQLLSCVLRYCKTELRLESTSIVSNGSKMRESWMRGNARCRKYNVKFKLNTVVNAYNWDEDMAAQVAALAAFRWKVFQCLIDKGSCGMRKSGSILHVGVREAMKQAVWDTKSFVQRGGIYKWGRAHVKF